MENVMPRVLGRDNISQKMSASVMPAMKSKSRVLSNVMNKDVRRVSNGKEALERQRANAAKLSSGLSVVHQNADKENAVANKKPIKIASKSQTGKTNVKKVGLSQTNESVAALYTLEEMKIKEVESIPIIKIQSSETVFVSEKADEICPDINEGDDGEAMSSEFLLGVYAKDIYKFLRYLESCQIVRKGYISPAHIMTHNMRALLVDWLFEVQQSFKLLNETIQLAIALLDRFMQDNPSIPKHELQLVGVACIFLASKYEETYPPDLDDLVDISAKTYTKDEILNMEMVIFSSLNFQMGRPTPSQFLRRYGRAGKVNIVVYCFAKYFIDLGLVSYAMCHIPPSLLAASAMYLSLYITSDEANPDVWTPTLKYYSQYTWTHLQPVVCKLATLVVHATKSKYQTVLKKYLDPKRHHSVSARSELKSEKLIELANLI